MPSYNETRDNEIERALASIAGAVRWFDAAIGSAPEFVRTEAHHMAEQIAEACDRIRALVQADTELDDAIADLEALRTKALQDKVVALYPADERYCRHSVVTHIEERRTFCHICRTFVSGGSS